jgi:hypothetical protein
MCKVNILARERIINMDRKKALFFMMAFLMVAFGGCRCEDDKPEQPGLDYGPPLLEQPILEYDRPLEGSFEFINGSPDTFISPNGLRWSLEGSEFDTNSLPEDFILTINDERFPSKNLVIEKHLLSADITLKEGRNKVFLKAWDKVGRTLYYEETLWVGSNTVTISLVNSDGTPFTSPTHVVASLGDNPAVAARVETSNGTATLQNVPDRTILIEAKSTNNVSGFIGIIGSQKTAEIRMKGFGIPVSNDKKNHHFGVTENSEGQRVLEGWKAADGTDLVLDDGTNNTGVKLIPHQEKIPGFFPVSTNNILALRNIVGAAALPTENLSVSTQGAGEEERLASYTFETDPDTTAVKIRYRFKTAEFPKYYDTEFNDYFRVSIRSQLGGSNVSEANSMNGLGKEAFTEAGETDWREHTLTLNRQGDTIEIEVAVANVGDADYDSEIIIAFVEEIKEQVRPSLAWNGTQGGLSLTWEVLGSSLTQDATIDVHFANGTRYENRLGAPVFSHTIPANTPAGAGGPVRIDGLQLRNAPAGTTHLVAFASSAHVGSISDARVTYGPNAVRNVDERLINIIMEGQRVNGVNSATITSTLRTPADQARVMFNNIRNTGVQAQLALYAEAGDAVIQVYADQTAEMTPEQIGENAMTIRAAMEAEIDNQGPTRVSLHCGDPATMSIADVAVGALGALFVNDVTPRIRRLIDERPNGIQCYHLEFTR